MSDMDIDRPDGLSLMNWDRAPFNRWAFQHIREFLPTTPVGRGRPMPLPEAGDLLDLETITFRNRRGEMATVQQALDASCTDGFLVLHQGRIVCEQYQNGMQQPSVHLTQSVSKSVIGTLAGILHHRGDFPLDKTVAAYVPEFSQCAYRDVTMRQLLDMTSGVDFLEDNADPISGIGRMDIAVGWKQVPADNPNPRSVRALIASLDTTTRRHGARFEYRSMETEVLGFCIEAAVQGKLPSLVSELIWQPIGAEAEANFGVDPEGYAIADGGLSASLRDLGRFAMIYARNGYLNDRQIVPEEWIRQTHIGDTTRFAESYRTDWPKGAYRNQFWIDDVEGSVIMARGVFGQLIYMDHEQDFVGVKLSSWPVAVDPALRIEARDMMAAIEATLRDTAQ